MRSRFMTLGLGFALTICAPNPGFAQQPPVVRADTQTPLCAAVVAELRAVGVSVVSAGPSTIMIRCEDGVLVVVEGERSERFVQDESEEQFASRQAELLRARLLIIPDGPFESDEAAEDTSNTNRLAPTRTAANPPDSPDPPDLLRASDLPGGRRNERNAIVDSEQLPASPTVLDDGDFQITMALGAGGLFAKSVLAANPGASIALGFTYGYLALRFTAAGFLFGPNASFTDPRLAQATLNATFVDLALDASFVRQIRATPIFLGLGAGLASLRIDLNAKPDSATPTLVQGGHTVVWSLIPYLRGEFSVELSHRWRLGAVGRLGAFGRPVSISLPGSESDESDLRFSGWVLQAALVLEAQWDV